MQSRACTVTQRAVVLEGFFNYTLNGLEDAGLPLVLDRTTSTLSVGSEVNSAFHRQRVFTSIFVTLPHAPPTLQRSVLLRLVEILTKNPLLLSGTSNLIVWLLWLMVRIHKQTVSVRSNSSLRGVSNASRATLLNVCQGSSKPLEAFGPSVGKLSPQWRALTTQDGSEQKRVGQWQKASSLMVEETRLLHNPLVRTVGQLIALTAKYAGLSSLEWYYWVACLQQSREGHLRSVVGENLIRVIPQIATRPSSQRKVPQPYLAPWKRDDKQAFLKFIQNSIPSSAGGFLSEPTVVHGGASIHAPPPPPRLFFDFPDAGEASSGSLVVPALTSESWPKSEGYTVCLWVKWSPDASPTPRAARTIIGFKCNESSPGTCVNLAVHSHIGQLRFAVISQGKLQVVWLPVYLPAREWCCLSFTHSKQAGIFSSKKTLAVYLNGVCVAERSDVAFPVFTGSYRFSLGNSPAQSLPSSPFVGKIAGVYVFQSCLPAHHLYHLASFGPHTIARQLLPIHESTMRQVRGGGNITRKAFKKIKNVGSLILNNFGRLALGPEQRTKPGKVSSVAARGELAPGVDAWKHRANGSLLQGMDESGLPFHRPLHISSRAGSQKVAITAEDLSSFGMRPGGKFDIFSKLWFGFHASLVEERTDPFVNARKFELDEKTSASSSPPPRTCSVQLVAIDLARIYKMVTRRRFNLSMLSGGACAALVRSPVSVQRNVPCGDVLHRSAGSQGGAVFVGMIRYLDTLSRKHLPESKRVDGRCAVQSGCCGKATAANTSIGGKRTPSKEPPLNVDKLCSVCSQHCKEVPKLSKAEDVLSLNGPVHSFARSSLFPHVLQAVVAMLDGSPALQDGFKRCRTIPLMANMLVRHTHSSHMSSLLALDAVMDLLECTSWMVPPDFWPPGVPFGKRWKDSPLGTEMPSRRNRHRPPVDGNDARSLVKSSTYALYHASWFTEGYALPGLNGCLPLTLASLPCLFNDVLVHLCMNLGVWYRDRSITPDGVPRKLLSVIHAYPRYIRALVPLQKLLVGVQRYLGYKQRFPWLAAYVRGQMDGNVTATSLPVESEIHRFMQFFETRRKWLLLIRRLLRWSYQDEQESSGVRGAVFQRRQASSGMHAQDVIVIANAALQGADEFHRADLVELLCELLRNHGAVVYSALVSSSNGMGGPKFLVDLLKCHQPIGVLAVATMHLAAELTRFYQTAQPSHAQSLPRIVISHLFIRIMSSGLRRTPLSPLLYRALWEVALLQQPGRIGCRHSVWGTVRLLCAHFNEVHGDKQESKESTSKQWYSTIPRFPLGSPRLRCEKESAFDRCIVGMDLPSMFRYNLVANEPLSRTGSFTGNTLEWIQGRERWPGSDRNRDPVPKPKIRVPAHDPFDWVLEKKTLFPNEPFSVAKLVLPEAVELMLTLAQGPGSLVDVSAVILDTLAYVTPPSTYIMHPFNVNKVRKFGQFCNLPVAGYSSLGAVSRSARAEASITHDIRTPWYLRKVHYNEANRLKIADSLPHWSRVLGKHIAWGSGRQLSLTEGLRTTCILEIMSLLFVELCVGRKAGWVQVRDALLGFNRMQENVHATPSKRFRRMVAAVFERTFQIIGTSETEVTLSERGQQPALADTVEFVLKTLPSACYLYSDGAFNEKSDLEMHYILQRKQLRALDRSAQNSTGSEALFSGKGGRTRSSSKGGLSKSVKSALSNLFSFGKKKSSNTRRRQGSNANTRERKDSNRSTSSTGINQESRIPSVSKFSCVKFGLKLPYFVDNLIRVTELVEEWIYYDEPEAGEVVELSDDDLTDETSQSDSDSSTVVFSDSDSEPSGSPSPMVNRPHNRVRTRSYSSRSRAYSRSAKKGLPVPTNPIVWRQCEMIPSKDETKSSHIAFYPEMGLPYRRRTVLTRPQSPCVTVKDGAGGLWVPDLTTAASRILDYLPLIRAMVACFQCLSIPTQAASTPLHELYLDSQYPVHLPEFSAHWVKLLKRTLGSEEGKKSLAHSGNGESQANEGKKSPKSEDSDSSWAIHKGKLQESGGMMPILSSFLGQIGLIERQEGTPRFAWIGACTPHTDFCPMKSDGMHNEVRVFPCPRTQGLVHSALDLSSGRLSKTMIFPRPRRGGALRILLRLLLDGVAAAGCASILSHSGDVEGKEEDSVDYSVAVEEQMAILKGLTMFSLYEEGNGMIGESGLHFHSPKDDSCLGGSRKVPGRVKNLYMTRSNVCAEVEKAESSNKDPWMREDHLKASYAAMWKNQYAVWVISNLVSSLAGLSKLSVQVKPGKSFGFLGRIETVVQNLVESLAPYVVLGVPHARLLSFLSQGSGAQDEMAKDNCLAVARCCRLGVVPAKERIDDKTTAKVVCLTLFDWTSGEDRVSLRNPFHSVTQVPSAWHSTLMQTFDGETYDVSLWQSHVFFSCMFWVTGVLWSVGSLDRGYQKLYSDGMRTLRNHIRRVQNDYESGGGRDRDTAVAMGSYAGAARFPVRVPYSDLQRLNALHWRFIRRSVMLSVGSPWASQFATFVQYVSQMRGGAARDIGRGVYYWVNDQSDSFLRRPALDLRFYGSSHRLASHPYRSVSRHFLLLRALFGSSSKEFTVAVRDLERLFNESLDAQEKEKERELEKEKERELEKEKEAESLLVPFSPGNMPVPSHLVVPMARGDKNRLPVRLEDEPSDSESNDVFSEGVSDSEVKQHQEDEANSHDSDKESSSDSSSGSSSDSDTDSEDGSASASDDSDEEGVSGPPANPPTPPSQVLFRPASSTRGPSDDLVKDARGYPLFREKRKLEGSVVLSRVTMVTPIFAVDGRLMLTNEEILFVPFVDRATLLGGMRLNVPSEEKEEVEVERSSTPVSVSSSAEPDTPSGISDFSEGPVDYTDTPPVETSKAPPKTPPSTVETPRSGIYVRRRRKKRPTTRSAASFLPENIHMRTPFPFRVHSLDEARLKLCSVHRFDLADLIAVFRRRFQLQRTAVEFFLSDGTSYFFDCGSVDAQKRVVRKIEAQQPPNLISWCSSARARDILRHSRVIERWQRREISNFQFLIYMNIISGRTFNDLNQYPVFPWVLMDLRASEETKDGEDDKDVIAIVENGTLSERESVFRNLGKPVGALNPDRLERIQMRFESLMEDDTGIPPFHYGSHYSNAAIVLFFLMRLEPYSSLYIELQGGRFDMPDRLFYSLEQCLKTCLTSPSCFKELIPEFFYLPELFCNVNEYDLGVRQDGCPVGDVTLPRWANDAAHFVQVHRAALESDYVSANLHEWIDLIFGYKQTGPYAAAFNNVFYYLTYESAVDLENVENETERETIINQIASFGQTPRQMFGKPMVSRNSKRDCAADDFTTSVLCGIMKRNSRKALSPLRMLPVSMMVVAQLLDWKHVYNTSPCVGLGAADPSPVYVSGDMKFSQQPSTLENLRIDQWLLLSLRHGLDIAIPGRVVPVTVSDVPPSRTPLYTHKGTQQLALAPPKPKTSRTMAPFSLDRFYRNNRDSVSSKYMDSMSLLCCPWQTLDSIEPVLTFLMPQSVLGLPYGSRNVHREDRVRPWMLFSEGTDAMALPNKRGWFDVPVFAMTGGSGACRLRWNSNSRNVEPQQLLLNAHRARLHSSNSIFQRVVSKLRDSIYAAERLRHDNKNREDGGSSDFMHAFVPQDVFGMQPSMVPQLLSGAERRRLERQIIGPENIEVDSAVLRSVVEYLFECKESLGQGLVEDCSRMLWDRYAMNFQLRETYIGVFNSVLPAPVSSVGWKDVSGDQRVFSRIAEFCSDSGRFASYPSVIHPRVMPYSYLAPPASAGLRMALLPSHSSVYRLLTGHGYDMSIGMYSVMTGEGVEQSDRLSVIEFSETKMSSRPAPKMSWGRSALNMVYANMPEVSEEFWRAPAVVARLREQAEQKGQPPSVESKGEVSEDDSDSDEPEQKQVYSYHYDSKMDCKESNIGQLNFQILQRLEGHSLPVTCLSLSQDGRMFATGSVDCSVCLWKIVLALETDDPSSGSVYPYPLHVLRGHRAPIVNVHLNTELNVVISTGADGLVLQHRVSTGQLLPVVVNRTMHPTDDAVCKGVLAAVCGEDFASDEERTLHSVLRDACAKKTLSSDIGAVMPSACFEVYTLWNRLTRSSSLVSYALVSLSEVKAVSVGLSEADASNGVAPRTIYSYSKRVVRDMRSVLDPEAADGVKHATGPQAVSVTPDETWANVVPSGSRHRDSSCSVCHKCAGDRKSPLQSDLMAFWTLQLFHQLSNDHFVGSMEATLRDLSFYTPVAQCAQLRRRLRSQRLMGLADDLFASVLVDWQASLEGFVTNAAKRDSRAPDRHAAYDEIMLLMQVGGLFVDVLSRTSGMYMVRSTRARQYLWRCICIAQFGGTLLEEISNVSLTCGGIVGGFTGSFDQSQPSTLTYILMKELELGRALERLCGTCFSNDDWQSSGGVDMCDDDKVEKSNIENVWVAAFGPIISSRVCETCSSDMQAALPIKDVGSAQSEEHKEDSMGQKISTSMRTLIHTAMAVVAATRELVFEYARAFEQQQVCPCGSIWVDGDSECKDTQDDEWTGCVLRQQTLQCEPGIRQKALGNSVVRSHLGRAWGLQSGSSGQSLKGSTLYERDLIDDVLMVLDETEVAESAQITEAGSWEDVAYRGIVDPSMSPTAYFYRNNFPEQFSKPKEAPKPQQPSVSLMNEHMLPMRVQQYGQPMLSVSTTNGLLIKRVALDVRLSAISESPCGQLIACGSYDGSVVIRRSNDLHVVQRTLDLHTPVTALQFSPDTKYVMVGTAKGQTIVISVNSAH